MLNNIIKILTSYKKPLKTCVIGNEAVARGAIEAGVNGVFSYPGTPSTEISEIFSQVNNFQNNTANKEKHAELTTNPIYFEYSINEKIALEKAIAYSIGNKNAMCVMKNVGMNVASDPLMTIAYQTIGASLVIVICDDPGCHSSSNEQDSRYWAKMASVPLFNPATPEDAYSMTKDAFDLSGQIKLPVIVRMTTRISHTRGMVYYSRITSDKKPGKFEKIPEHINIPARTATVHQKLLDKLHSNIITPFFKKYNQEFAGQRNAFALQGIIVSGVTFVYLSEILFQNKLNDSMRVLKLGIIHPFPVDNVLKFLQNGFKKILILEELEPIIENEIRVIAQKNKINCEIAGKGFSTLTATGEYSLDIVTKALEELVEKPLKQNEKFSLNETKKYLANLPSRPPALCAGCPHRATFYALKLAIPRDDSSSFLKAGSRDTAFKNDDSNIVLCGDIGCFGLGALPPLQMIDTIHHMGMSISMAQGLSEALQAAPPSPHEKEKRGIGETERRKTKPFTHSPIHPFADSVRNSGGVDLRVAGREGLVVALIGDGTFFHSGIASLLNAIYTKANFLLIIFDNRTIGMTGGQDNPGASQTNKYREIDLSKLLKGMGIQYVETIDPFNVRNSYNKIKEAIAVDGVSVIVSKSPCIFLPEYKEVHSADRSVLTVDHSLCNICHNHKDEHIPCSRICASGSNLMRSKAKISANHSIPGKLQQCPANICNHGFFFSILEENYKEAIEIVRDKMLFARTCGDICHRPCELFVERNDIPATSPIPIKQLKKFVSSIDENFHDFSLPKMRVKSATKKNKHIAIVGAGPAGLSAAYDLIQTGYKVTIFEKEKEAGGLIKYAIPNFRMDKTGFDYEVSQLAEMGVNFKFNTTLGNDTDTPVPRYGASISLEKLSEKFDAVLLSVGMGKSKTLKVIENAFSRSHLTPNPSQKVESEERVEWVTGGKVFDAISFLKSYNLNTIDIKPASSFLVIGGGNSAIDSARVAKKLDTENTVIVSCIEPEKEMPAFAEEIEHAVDEGIQFIHESFVETCSVNTKGKIKIGLSSFKTKKHLRSLRCDYVIVAIGQSSSTFMLKSDSNTIQLDENNRIKSDKNNAHTGYKNIFAAGDISAGNQMSIIAAIASGKKAAIGIRQMLEDHPFPYEGLKVLEDLNLNLSVMSNVSTRQSSTTWNGKNDDLIEELKQYNLFQACEKCNHCINNFGCPALIKVNGKIEIDNNKCTRCGLCIDVCPNNAIQWLSG